MNIKQHFEEWGYKKLNSIAFVDLDDTIVSSPKRLQMKNCAINAEDGTLANSNKQRAFLSLILNQGEPIAVTARDHKAFLEVDEFLPYSLAPVAIINYGAAIIYAENNKDDNPIWKLDLKYHNGIEAKFKEIIGYGRLEVMSLLKQELEGISKEFGVEVSVKVDIIDNVPVPCYIKIQTSDQDVINSNQFRRKMYEFWVKHTSLLQHFDLHRTQKGVVLVPLLNTKFTAVKILMEELKQINPDIMTIGAGNDTSDLPFLMLMDYSVLANEVKPFAMSWIKEAMKREPQQS